MIHRLGSLFDMSFWPGLDRWPPPKEVWIAAAVMTFVVTPLLILLGVAGQIILGAIVVACVVMGLRTRLKQVDVRAEELRRAAPED
ncbi:MAG TPA: hypothetical protein VFN92_06095 [Solirubrobacterales bacterium]|nr:hypothetical protein [Solirubrobacterales bacterium]